jgi:hypothetical protein
MQFNVLPIYDNGNLLNTIEWINENTEHNSVIVGEKHFRGFMELNLKDNRTFAFSENPDKLVSALKDGRSSVYKMDFIYKINTTQNTNLFIVKKLR